MDISNLQMLTQHLLEQIGLSEKWGFWVAVLINLAILFILCFLLGFLMQMVIRKFIRVYTKKYDNEKVETFIKRRPISALTRILIGYIVFALTPVFIQLEGKILKTIRVLAIIYMIVFFIKMVKRVLKALEEIALNSEKYKGKPISSYIQVALLVFYIVGTVAIISVLIGRSPLAIITTFGAATAVVLLVFKDPLMGLIASIEITANDIVRVGDWISMSKFQTDGEIEQLDLITVRVRNWDKTLTNIPTYALISEGFQNWRPMQELGYRRIMGHVYIDANAVKIVSQSFIDNLKVNKYVGKYLKNHKNDVHADPISNLSLFREYMYAYLEAHPMVATEYYQVIRQLDQTTLGIPIQIYIFCRDITFKVKEATKTEIFENFTAVISEFDLALFQGPAGRDISELNRFNSSISNTR